MQLTRHEKQMIRTALRRYAEDLARANSPDLIHTAERVRILRDKVSEEIREEEHHE